MMKIEYKYAEPRKLVRVDEIEIGQVFSLKTEPMEPRIMTDHGYTDLITGISRGHDSLLSHQAVYYIENVVLQIEKS